MLLRVAADPTHVVAFLPTGTSKLSLGVETKETPSSTLIAFRSAVEREPGRVSVLTEALVEDLRRARGPLLEAARGSEDIVVTFVYVRAANRVSLLSALTPASAGVAAAMDRITDTDVWYYSIRVRKDVSVFYQFVVDDPFAELSWPEIHDLYNQPPRLASLLGELAARSYADPHNPRLFEPPPLLGSDTPARQPSNWQSLLVPPSATPPLVVGPDSPLATVETHDFHSDACGNERTIDIVLPLSENGVAEPALVIALDGGALMHRRFPNLLASLTADGKIPPLLGVCLHNESRSSRTRELACNPSFTDMVADELLPFLRTRYQFTSDPRRTVIAGYSLGGLAATFAAFSRPEIFGNVLASSGSFHWTPTKISQNSVSGEEPEWLTRQIAAVERRPIQFWLDAGILEIEPIDSLGVSLLGATRHLRTVLQTRGYDVTYLEVPGGHDGANWLQTLSSGLQALLASPHRDGA